MIRYVLISLRRAASTVEDINVGSEAGISPAPCSRSRDVKSRHARWESPTCAEPLDHSDSGLTVLLSLVLPFPDWFSIIGCMRWQL